MINPKNPLPFIKQTFDALVPKLDMEGIKHVFVSGSVARNEFYPGWSDIDVIVVADSSIAKQTIDALALWRAGLSGTLQCKVGTDYVALDRLTKCLMPSEYQKQHINDGLHFLKNYHVVNETTLLNGTLYRDPSYKVKSLSGEAFIGLGIIPYLHALQEQVYETFLRADCSGSNDIHALRIVTKASLYLLQTCLLVTDGKLITNYTRIPAASRSLFTSDSRLIAEIYSALESAKKNPEHGAISLPDDTAEKLFVCFNTLMREAQELFSTPSVTYTESLALSRP